MLPFDELVRRAWPVLMEAIRMRRTVSYSELAGRAGPPLHQRHLHRQLLRPLSARCRHLGLPDLAALVVRKDSGLPGGGWFTGEGHPGPKPGQRAASGENYADWAEALAACYAHRWPAQPYKKLLEPLSV